MLPIFERYFRSRLTLDLRFSRRRLAIPQILTLIPNHWRSDAQYFLVHNVQEMIVLPFLAARRLQTPEQRLAEIWPDLAADIRALVGRAESIARDRERSYVSATSVAVALGQLAPELKTARWQIWGPS